MLYKNIGIKKGITIVKVNPLVNASIATFALVFLEITGNVVSIAVAPPGAMAQ